MSNKQSYIDALEKKAGHVLPIKKEPTYPKKRKRRPFVRFASIVLIITAVCYFIKPFGLFDHRVEE